MVAVSSPLQSGGLFARPVPESASLSGIMLGVVLAVTAIDCVWAWFHHFDVDRAAYLRLAVLALLLWLASVFYGRVRKAPPIAAMLLGTAFLIAFSAGFSVLNYFLLTVAHTRIDAQLAALDVAMGVNWPAMVTAFAPHPIVNGLLRVCYESVLPEVALLIICLSWREQPKAIQEFCVALAIGAVLTVAVWTLFPSFGAFSVYHLPQEISARLNLSLDGHYAHELVQLLANGPGRISPAEIKGLIGFPSFHAAMAILVVWYGRSLPFVRWPLVAWNGVVLVATPIQGGHHVVDVLGGFGVVAVAIVLASRLARSTAREIPGIPVDHRAQLLA